MSMTVVNQHNCQYKGRKNEEARTEIVRSACQTSTPVTIQKDEIVDVEGCYQPLPAGGDIEAHL